MDNEDEDFFNRLGVLMEIGIYLFKINRHGTLLFLVQVITKQTVCGLCIYDHHFSVFEGNIRDY